MRDQVRDSPELARVLALPRRTWEGEGAAELAREVTDLLRTDRVCPSCREARVHATGCPDRTKVILSLNVIQAVGLRDAWEQQGLLAPIGVGRGKTLLSLLLAYVLESSRPLLVLPAKLIGKTRHEWIALAAHWKIPNWIRLISYELVGRVQAKEELERFQPDLIVFDECHKVKNRKAAVTRRFERYIHDRRDAEGTFAQHAAAGTTAAGTVASRLRVCAMSGTITSKSLRDFAHIVQWSIPHHSVVPWTWVELEQWDNALGELTNPLSRLDPGALLAFCDARENDAQSATEAARRGFRRRLVETPGVVATSDSTLGTSLLIEHIMAPESAAIDDAFDRLRGCSAKDYPGMQLPDGTELIDGPAVWRHARELALGFYYVWDPWPPPEWLEARSLWTAFARSIIKRGQYDSEQDVALVAHRFPATVDQMRELKGMLPHPDKEIGNRHVWDHWSSLRGSYEKNQKAIWICESALKTCYDWMKGHPKGIVWVDHVAFGNRLEEFTGFPYFGSEGVDKSGRMIEQARGPVIASWNSNRDGRNLQFEWCDNLFTACSADGEQMEQGLGRTHRTGQLEDTVTADVYTGCIEHLNSFWRATERARYMQDTTGNPQKLCYADITIPTLSEAAAWAGSRWG